MNSDFDFSSWLLVLLLCLATFELLDKLLP